MLLCVCWLLVVVVRCSLIVVWRVLCDGCCCLWLFVGLLLVVFVERCWLAVVCLLLFVDWRLLFVVVCRVFVVVVCCSTQLIDACCLLCGFVGCLS